MDWQNQLQNDAIRRNNSANALNINHCRNQKMLIFIVSKASLVKSKILKLRCSSGSKSIDNFLSIYLLVFEISKNISKFF